MLSKSEKILAAAELFPTRQGNSKKMTKARFVLCHRLGVLSLCNRAKPYFLAWWSLTAQAKGRFQDLKELKMN